jgi:hypothetical protein
MRLLCFYEYVLAILSPPRLPFRHSGAQIILGYLAARGNLPLDGWLRQEYILLGTLI